MIPLVLACSGPLAAETIATSMRIGLVALAVALGLSIAIIAKTHGKKRWAALGVVLIHPGWWMSAISGDCGYMLRYTSVTATAVFAGVAAWVIWRSRVKIPA